MPPRPMPPTRINLNPEAQAMLRSLGMCMALMQHIVEFFTTLSQPPQPGSFRTIRVALTVSFRRGYEARKRASPTLA